MRSLLDGGESQPQAVAATIQHIRPDIVLLNEFDWDDTEEGATTFARDYLGVAQRGDEPIEYPYQYVPPTNTGEHSGVDLNQDGQVVSEPGAPGYGDDAFGFGNFAGQYGMVIYSKFPIATADIRTFRRFRWTDMPGNVMPTDWYSPEAVEVMRLSSKNHVDVPIEVAGGRIHILASHPTPPGFDGPEDRNGRRNHDEIRLWTDYISVGGADYLVDDAGRAGGLDAEASFVVLGDLNSDPLDADSRHEGIVALLSHPRVTDSSPASGGGAEAAEADGEANRNHRGDPSLDTADFSDGVVGNIRVDYVLPSSDLTVADGGVVWPLRGTADRSLLQASDHRLVWVELEF